MTKDMLGSAVRAAVGVPQDRLDLLAKIASKLAVGGPEVRSEGEIWHSYLKKIFQEGLPSWAYLLDVKADEIQLGEIIVNYDETIENKLKSEKGRAVIEVGRYLDNRKRLSPGQFAPAPRKGVVRYRASALNFSVYLTRYVIHEWARRNKKIMAGIQEGVELALTMPLMKLARIVPIVTAAEPLYDSQEFSYVPAFRGDDAHLRLEFERFNEGNTPTAWSPAWRFLMLEEIPAVD